MSIKYTSTEKHNIKQYVKYKVGDSKNIVDVLIISRASKALKKKKKKKKKQNWYNTNNVTNNTLS